MILYLPPLIWFAFRCKFVVHINLLFCSQARTNRPQAVFSFSPTSYSILDRTRQFLLTALPDFSKIGLSYGNVCVNTQKPWFSAKKAPDCIRIWNHTQKYYDLKSRQALPDGVFGHFKARKSYPFILLQNRRLEICSKTHSKDPRFHPKPSQKSISKMQKKKQLFFPILGF